MSYLLLKHAHITLAAISGSLFAARGLWVATASPVMRRPWVNRIPHLIDSLLLASAIALAWWSEQSPLTSHWLGAKLLALIAYILLGSLALKYGTTRWTRSAAFFGALACFAYIASVALTKNPLFFL